MYVRMMTVMINFYCCRQSRVAVGVMFSIAVASLEWQEAWCSFIHLLWTLYFQTTWNDSDASWHKWITGQGHETI